MWLSVFFFQAEDGIRDLVRSRGLGDVYKRQPFAARGLAILFKRDLGKCLLLHGRASFVLRHP